VKYLIEEYWQGDLKKVCEVTGYSITQLSDWIGGERCPQKVTIEYLMHTALVPEFKVIVEFGTFDSGEKVLTQLKELFDGHEERAGVYAFYDSMANLLYVGKATNLLNECYSAIRREVDVPFPSGIKTKPKYRYEIVRYISAYDVGESAWVDLPKHVESLILRISKPALNKQIGFLESAHVQPTES